MHQYPIQFEIVDDTDIMRNFKIVNKSRPISTLTNIKQIACGVDHFCALDNNGKVFTMGDDTLGQCGLGEDGRANAGPFFERRIPNPRPVPSRLE